MSSSHNLVLSKLCRICGSFLKSKEKLFLVKNYIKDVEECFWLCNVKNVFGCVTLRMTSLKSIPQKYAKNAISQWKTLKKAIPIPKQSRSGWITLLATVKYVVKKDLAEEKTSRREKRWRALTSTQLVIPLFGPESLPMIWKIRFPSQVRPQTLTSPTLTWHSTSHYLCVNVASVKIYW